MSNLAKVSDFLLQIAEDIKKRNDNRLEAKEISNFCKVANTMAIVEGTESRQMSVGDPSKGGGMKAKNSGK